MWRLIIVTFAFLGWAFYELSGGAAYAPADGSRQAVAALKAKQAADRARRIALAPKPEKRPEMRPATPDGAAVVLASAKPAAPVVTSNSNAFDTAKRVSLTLNADRPAAGVATITADPDKIAALTGPQTAPLTPAIEQTPPAREIRQVSGARVNMRMGPGTKYNIVARLSRGAPVEVLRDEGDGWVKLRVVDTGRIGWMADYLLVAAD